MTQTHVTLGFRGDNKQVKDKVRHAHIEYNVESKIIWYYFNGVKHVDVCGCDFPGSDFELL